VHLNKSQSVFSSVTAFTAVTASDLSSLVAVATCYSGRNNRKASIVVYIVLSHLRE